MAIAISGARTGSGRRLKAAWLALALSAAACGGGSGDDGGPTLSVTPSSFAFTAAENGALPPPQQAQVTFSSPEAVYVLAIWFDAQPGWATLGLTGSGTSWTFVVSVTSTALPPGTYTATAAVGLLRADQSVITYREIPVTYTVNAALSASPPALAFTHVVGGPLPAAQAVSVGGAGLAWTASASQTWIDPSATSGTAPSTVQVSVDPAGLAPGTYSGTLAFSRAAGGGTVSVDVTLTVEAPAIAASPASLSFSGVNGTAIPDRHVSVSLTSGGTTDWTASADADWVVLSSPGGTTPGLLSIWVDPSRGPLASGAYVATVTLSASVGGIALTKTIAVSLALTRPTLTVAPTSLALGGATGRDLAPAEVRLALSTGTAAHPWAATPSAGWIAVDAPSGTVSAAGGTVTVGVDASAIAAGAHAGSVAFAATVNGDVVTSTLPVTLALDQRRLLASDAGVAFASMPGLSRLSRTLRVRDSFGGGATWSATTSATWLSAAPGAGPDDLVITADPAGLTADSLHEATVTIAPDAAGIEPDTVRVGLWVGSAAPPAIRTVAGSFRTVVMDPVRPWAYVHRGGEDVEVYHAFTGALVATFARVAPALGALATSTDGTRLFAVDQTNLKVVPLELPAGTKGAGWSLQYTPRTIVYARPNGRGIVFVGGTRAYDVATGAQLDATPLFLSSEAVAGGAVDGSRLCWAPTGASGHDVYCHALDHTAAGSRLVVGPVRTGYTDGYNGDLAMNGDGSRVYHQDGVWDTATMQRVQTVSPRGRAYTVTRDGRVVVGSPNWYDEFDLRVRDVDGFVLSSYRIAGYAKWILDAQLEATGDGLCVATITDDPKLAFVAIGP